MAKNDKRDVNLITDLNDRIEDLVECMVPIRTYLVSISNIFTVILSMLLAFYFRHEFSFHTPESRYLTQIIIIAIVVKFIVFAIFRLYEGMWRYVSISDLIKIFLANFVASGFLLTILFYFRGAYFPGFSAAVLFIDFLICFLIMSGNRVVIRIIREYSAKSSGVRTLRTLIVGSTENVNGALQAFSAVSSRRKIIGILCEGVKTGYSLRGIPVLGEPSSAAKCAKKHKGSEILLLPPYSTPKFIRETMDDLENRGVKCTLRMVPAYSDIADGNISVSNIKEVEIEDLLGRKPVKLDRTEVAEFIKGKNILVSGAGGSIGSELCSQIAAYKPAKLVLFELCEFNLYEIGQELRRKYPELNVVNFLGDVRSSENVFRALSSNGIEVVYHAAAFKHVPLVEENPSMAFDTNVLGTSAMADACEKAGVSKLVLISTDKAVRPTSIMGATKRLAERILLEREKKSTEFVVVRFGNVLGSSGSVIPLFKQQIKNGGPVTVTSRNMIRYFMSIPEAVDLVLQAGTIGKHGDIMVLEMGEQVKIYDMARKLIELSGFVPDKDIEIKVTGMRPGEKEYEELLTGDELSDKTSFDRIQLLRKKDFKLPEINLSKIRECIESNDGKAMLELLKFYIPEHKLDDTIR